MGEVEDNLVLKKLKEKLKMYSSIEVFDKQSVSLGKKKKDANKRLISNSDIFLALFSEKWTSRDSYYENIKDAIERTKKDPPNATFIIPVKLDNCEIPYPELKELQELNLFEITDSRKDVFDKKVIRLVSAIAAGSHNDQLAYEVATLLNDDYEGKNDEELKEITKYADIKYTNVKEKVKMTPKDYFMAGLYKFACRDDYKEAKKRFDEALAHNLPRDAKILSKIGACDIELGNWNDAISQLNEAIELNQGYPPPYFNRGMWYKRKGEKHLKDSDNAKAIQMFEKAIEDFEQAIKLLKGKTEDYRAVKTKNNISTTKKEMYLLTGKDSFLDEAINVLESLAQSNLRTNLYDFELVRYNLACYYSLKGNLTEVYIHLKVAFEDYLNVEYSIKDMELYNFKSGCSSKYKELIRISSNDYFEKVQHEVSKLIKQKNTDEINEVIDKSEKWLKDIGIFNSNAYQLLAYCYDSIGDQTKRKLYLDKYKAQIHNEIFQKTFS